MHLWTRLRTRLFSLLLSTQFERFGTGSRVAPPFRFWGLDQMRLGERVLINRDCWIHIADGNRPKAVKIIIGSNTGVGIGATISAAEKVEIGENVMMARNVYISDHSHAFSDPDVPFMMQGIDCVRPVSIGRGTWLGQNVVILPGVAIGEQCVIGANSVVNRPVPDFSIAVGAPARVVKTYNREFREWQKV